MKTLKESLGWKSWASIVVALGALVAIGGPYLYIHFVSSKAPAALGGQGSEQSPSTAVSPSAADVESSPDSTGSLDGEWMVAGGSQVGYRVKEVLFGQKHEAVGRTEAVTGNMTISGTQITEASFSADLTKVSSDEARRDRQFQGRIMNTSTYPTATFKMTQPVDAGSIPVPGESRKLPIAGELTLRGTTKPVTMSLTGKKSGSKLQISGQAPITFADWGIPNPSFGPISTEDHGVLEVSLVLSKDQPSPRNLLAWPRAGLRTWLWEGRRGR